MRPKARSITLQKLGRQKQQKQLRKRLERQQKRRTRP